MRRINKALTDLYGGIISSSQQRSMPHGKTYLFYGNCIHDRAQHTPIAKWPPLQRIYYTPNLTKFICTRASKPFGIKNYKSAPKMQIYLCISEKSCTFATAKVFYNLRREVFATRLRVEQDSHSAQKDKRKCALIRK